MWVGLALLWRRHALTWLPYRLHDVASHAPTAHLSVATGTSLEAVRGETARLAHLSLWPARDRARWRGSDRSPLKQRNSLLPSYPVEAAERSERGRGLRWRPLFFLFFLLFVYYKIVFFRLAKGIGFLNTKRNDTQFPSIVGLTTPRYHVPCTMLHAVLFEIYFVGPRSAFAFEFVFAVCVCVCTLE